MMAFCTDKCVVGSIVFYKCKFLDFFIFLNFLVLLSFASMFLQRDTYFSENMEKYIPEFSACQ